ncbi:proteolysis 6 [Tasmannia lanceolata]|uniref:proteolysis 6 n=1 Tax=Tasmannia lanceolata TaxID=3420 RepID=UPI004062949F
MEIDSPPDRNLITPQDRILRRLALCGVPEEKLVQLHPGLVDFVKENKSLLTQLVCAILPTNEDILEALQEVARVKSSEKPEDQSLKDQFHESFMWLQWLMFQGEPQAFLKNLAKRSAGQRGVCGAVWGHKDIAYRCRTCEHDPTCAICVPCFQNGNHKDHDYSIMKTGGGCCDCGDVTAWKREGFCSKHKGAEQIQPLPMEIATSIGPILDALLVCWKDKLLSAETAEPGILSKSNDIHRNVARSLSSTTVEMLLDFCKHSESLLSFVSQRFLLSDGLLDVLVRAERFLHKSVVRKLHELLLKLLGEPKFKFEFAKVFINYYPINIAEAIRELSNSESEKYPLLSTFSVQIFTVPTLTPRLVREVNLLGMLLGCLGDLFLSCVEEDGHLQASRWASLFDTTTFRVVEDFRYVLSHVEVTKYVLQELPDISRTWMRLLALVQGMDAQKRVTGLHVEEENDNLQTPFMLGHSIENIHSVLVAGAFAVDGIQDFDDSDTMRQAKVGRISLQSSVCSMMGSSSLLDCTSQLSDVKFHTGNYSVPRSVSFLILECLKAIENWLGINVDLRRLPNNNGTTGKSTLTLRRSLFKIRKAYKNSMENVYMDSEHTCTSGVLDDSTVEADCPMELDAVGVLTLKDWPEIIYDVSSKDVSVHIPLHRLLSQLLQRALKRCYGESGLPDMMNSVSTVPLSRQNKDFFGQILGGCHPHGFSAFIMEHPLRLRVFCSQVRAGMWRKNGDTAIFSSEYYRSIRWWGQSLECDLFLLQCCAALAPPDLYVKRIQERFGLLNYQSLNLELSNEYEPVLVQEMLTLIIQIVKERGFCGLSTAENLRREFVYKLAIGDSTHSQLMKALPHELSKSDQVQETLATIAVYSNPSGLKQGKYSLRKAYWKELDLYHPRWNSRDLQTAEERYLRYCKVSALTAQLPQWTKVFYPLDTISRIATSKTTFEIIRAAIFYAVFTDESSPSRAPEGVLLTALHLLSLALDICYMNKQHCVAKYDGNIDLSQNMMELNEENSLYVLAYVCEEIDVGPTNECDARKHQSMLSLLVSLMRRYNKENERMLVESNECNFSSLVETLLKRLAELNVDCMTKLRTLAPELAFHLSQNNNDTHNSVSSSDAEERRAKVRQRQAAMLENMRAAQFNFIENLKSADNKDLELPRSKQETSISDVRNASEDAAPVVCSLCRDPDSNNPVSFLIFLQKSRLVSFVERGSPSWQQVFQSDKEHISFSRNEMVNPSKRDPHDSNSAMISSSYLVQLVQNAVSEFAHDSEPAEVDVFLDYIKVCFPAIRSTQLPSGSYNTGTNEVVEGDIYKSILSGIHDIILRSDALEEGSTNNMCSESSVFGEYIISLLRETSKNPPPSDSENDLLQSGYMSQKGQFVAFDGFGPIDCDGIHISSCGHAVHQECHDRYLSSLKQRFTRRTVFERGYIVDPDKGELLCPVCRRLANSLLPTFSVNSNKVGKHVMFSEGSSTSIAGSSLASLSDNNLFRLPLAMSLLWSAANVVGKCKFPKNFSLQLNESMRASLQPVFHMLCRMYYSDRYDSFSVSGRLSHSLILWDTLRYSLISTEITARGGKSKTHGGGSHSGVEALYKELEPSTGFILSLLLEVSQTIQSQNRLEVLLRFRGIELFTQSICSGVSADDLFTDLGSQRGYSILRHLDKGVIFPDMQFWKRTADPILAHDPFSSLMWVMFCLPHPFLWSTESFKSLVHLFYVVCVIQAIIACRQNGQFDFDESKFGESLIREVGEIMGESVAAQQYFVSNHIDHPCHPKDMVRRLTYPYLRRCALLWKLLSSKAAAPLCDSSLGWGRLSPLENNDSLEKTSDLSRELKEISELERLFDIVSLEAILKDKVARSLVLKWCNHFCKEFGVRHYGHILHCSPAVPFKLMHLPRLYQDLLESYIKQPCPLCKVVPDEPLLCLLCGRLCSSSSKLCCRENGCQNHVMACSAGIGVFLMVRRTMILLQRSARQSLYPSPYLDAFGEEDVDMTRGKPLYLNEERYTALTYMVASHGLDWNFDVLRQTTIDALFAI